MRVAGRLVVVVVALGAALPAAVPAVAQSQDLGNATVPARVTGAVTAVWHADPATCAAHGLCAFSGSVTTALSSTAEVDLAGVVGRAFPDELDLDAQNPATVRVRREGPGDPATCVDSVDAQDFLGMEPAANGRVAIPLAQAALGPLLSSGRCAGPLPDDLPRALVSHPIDSRKVGRSPVTVDFSGRTPLPGRLFDGELISTLKVGIGRAQPRRVGSESGYPSRRHRRGPRVQLVSLDYGVEDVTGSLTVDFAGLPGPGCAPLDACDAAGSVGYSLSNIEAGFQVVGHRRVRGGGGGLGFALLALRQGRMHAQVQAIDEGFGQSQPRGRTTARVTLADGTVCSDSVSPFAPPLDGARGRGGALEVELGPASEPGVDAIRTRCPGPEQADLSGGGLLGGGVLAAGAFDPHTLGQPRIDLPLRTGGAFAGLGYGGSRSGEIVLHLRLQRARAEVTRAPVRAGLL